MTYAGLTKFARFQISSIAATTVDFGLTIFLVEICSFYYLSATSIGAFSGGGTNFTMCRNWVFKASGHNAFGQAIRYIITWTCSILLNISFVYILTSFGGLNYIISKIMTAIIVGITFNYSLQMKFVFVSNKNLRNNEK